MAISNINTIINDDIHKVWDIVVDVGKYSMWRSDLSKTEIINETQIDFIENVTPKKWFMKPFVSLYLKKQQKQFILDLKRHWNNTSLFQKSAKFWFELLLRSSQQAFRLLTKLLDLTPKLLAESRE